MSSVAIGERETRQMLGIARTYGGLPDGPDDPDAGAPLPWELLRELKVLVPCDLLSVSGQDTPRWEFFADQKLPRTRLTPDEADAFDRAYRTHYWDATCSYPDRTGDIVSVWRDSDLVPDREYRNTGMYTDFDRPQGVEHEIVLCLGAGGPQRTLRLLFARGPGSDFSDRDVAVLTLLRPHLQDAFLNAERRRGGLLPLTARQQEILRYVAAGYTNTQVARRIGVSAATVGKHLEHIFDRLQVTSRAGAVARLNPPI